jgi:Fe2+ or Zn2+ uptake regulation protein
MRICICCESASRACTIEDVRSPAELAIAFREQGLKVTPQRQLLFRLLHGNQQHPTADALFAVASTEMPGISLRTVYQTLTDLVSMGELLSLDLGTGATRFDPNVDEHHHVVCSACGTVRDVYVDGVDGLRLHAGDDLGFDVDTTSIVFRGRCHDCACPERSSPNPHPSPTHQLRSEQPWPTCTAPRPTRT